MCFLKHLNQFGTQIRLTLGRFVLREKVVAVSGGIEVEGEVHVSAAVEQVKIPYVLRAIDQIPFASTNNLTLASNTQRQILPGQHVAHHFRAGHTDEPPRVAGVISVADVKRPIKNRDHLLACWAGIP